MIPRLNRSISYIPRSTSLSGSKTPSLTVLGNEKTARVLPTQQTSPDRIAITPTTKLLSTSGFCLLARSATRDYAPTNDTVRL